MSKCWIDPLIVRILRQVWPGLATDIFDIIGNVMITHDKKIHRWKTYLQFYKGNYSSQHDCYNNSIYLSQLPLDLSGFQVIRDREQLVFSSESCPNYSPDGLVFDCYKPVCRARPFKHFDWIDCLIGERAAGEPQWSRARRVEFCGSRRRGASKPGNRRGRGKTGEKRRGERGEVSSSSSRTFTLTWSLGWWEWWGARSSSWLRTPQRRRCIDPLVGGSSMYEKD